MKELWGKHKDNILMGVLVLYVVSLAVVTVDQVFGPWIFLPEMDRQINTQINNLTGNDATAQNAAFNDIITTKGEFAVKALIKVLDSPHDSHVGNLVITALKEITGKDVGSDPAAWKKWYEENKKDFP